MDSGTSPTPRIALRGLPWLPHLLISTAVLLVYLPLLLRGQFFWDDYDLLINNPAIRSPSGLTAIWTGKTFDFFPLTFTSFWFEYRLFGPFVPGYHVVSLLLHAGSACLLWHIFRRLAVPGALLAALLFAIHPINVESVAWIAERKNTLSMFFLCASVLFYLRAAENRHRAAYLASLLLFLFSLLAKTAPVMLPCVLLLLAWRRHRTIAFRDLARTAPFFALSLLLGLITMHFQSSGAIGDTLIRTDSFLSRLATAGCALWFYAAALVVPAPVYFNYPRWNVLADYGAAAFLPLALFCALLGILWFFRRTVLRHAFVALAAYALMLLPILGFINIFYMRYALVSDHWQYHADPILLALLASLIVLLARRPSLRVAVITLTALGGLTLAAYSATIAATYRSPEAIWLDTLAHNPHSWLAHSQLGQLYLQQAPHSPGDLPRALDHLSQVVRLRPDLAVSYINLGQACWVAHDAPRALAAFRAGLDAPVATREDRKLLHHNLGSILATAGDLPAAEAEFRAVLALDPDSPGGQFSLGCILAQRGDVAGARLHLTAAVALGKKEAQLFLDHLPAAPATAPATPR